MEFVDKLKNLFGFSKNNTVKTYENEIVEPTLPHRRNVDVWTDPSAMHQIFEQQMSEMLKSFGFFGNSFFGAFDNPNNFGQEDDPQSNFFGLFNAPEEYFHSTPETSDDLRNHFLKKGYEMPSNSRNNIVDKDLDGRVNIGEIDSVLSDKESSKTVIPHHKPQSFFFGQSISTKTITNADGSVEMHHTKRDNEGNEETTISRRLGEKEYTVTKKRDKFGKEEIIENFVNMNESEKDLFLKGKQNLPPIEDKPSKFPFDFFK